MNAVTVKGLGKIYPAFELKDVTFGLKAGKITGFIGRNGAGKTTTIKAMLNLIHADAGEIVYFGLPLAGNESAIKQRIGYSTGTIGWYPRKTIREIAKIEKLFYKNWDEGAYRKYLQLFKLDESKRAMELSEGMKVKCNLLLALSHRAEVLILDEPTSGLDPFSRDELLEVFEQLKDDGATILFSTHITSDLEKCADEIIYISEGKIISAGSKDKFRANLGQEGETLEETFLRLERSMR